jgi:hypothetical protein
MVVSTAMVAVHLGPHQTEYILHGNLLRHKSEFFDEILKAKTDDGRSKGITLPDVGPAVFGHFVVWLYKDSISCHKAHGESDWEHLLEWCRLGLFAKKLGLASLEEAAVWQYGHCCKKAALHRPRIEIIRFLYEESNNNSEIKPLAVDRLLQIFLDPKFDDHKFMGTALSCNPAFAEDFSTALKAHPTLKSKAPRSVLSNKSASYARSMLPSQLYLRPINRPGSAQTQVQETKG